MKEKKSEENIPAAQHAEEEDARVSGAHEIKGRAPRAEKKAREGKKQTGRLTGKEGFKFGRGHRLLRKSEFEKAFGRGKRYSVDGLEFIYLPNGLDNSRLGLIVSRKTGRRANTRNRIKRLFREVFRLNEGRLATAADIVIKAYPKAASFGFDDVRAAFEKFADRLAQAAR